jgi:hypothetical protein
MAITRQCRSESAKGVHSRVLVNRCQVIAGSGGSQGFPADWQKQWRNIHDGVNAQVRAEFQVDGDPRPLTVQRSWAGTDITDASSQASWGDGEQCDLPGLGWSAALEQYRPFLSYDDLGKVSDKPSVVFDLLVGVLGLESIAGAQDLLTTARGDLGKTLSQPDEAMPALVKTLSGMDDERARRVTEARQVRSA